MIRHVPNAITCLNLVSGSIGIYYTLVVGKPNAIYFVLLGAFFDLLDGLIARLLGVSSEIGKQLDSLADLITFGLLPSFYLLVLLQGKTEFYWIALLTAVFSAVRLAKFNVDDSQSDHFKGLPTPANAIMITSLAFVPYELSEWVLIGLTLVSSYLLVSDIPLIALKFKSYGWKGNEFKLLLVAGSLVLMIVFQWTFVVFLIPFYLLVSLLSFFKKRDNP